MTASALEGWRTWSAYPGITDVLHSPWRAAEMHGTEFATWQKASKRARCGDGELIRTRTFGANTRHRDHGGRGSPDPECTCGIGVLTGYEALLDRVATFTRKNKPRKLAGVPGPVPATIVVGRVSASGRILNRGRKGSTGLDTSELRVEHAEIVELWIPAGPAAGILLAPFQARYGVPVHVGFPDRVDDLYASPDVRALISARAQELSEIPDGAIRPFESRWRQAHQHAN